MRYEFRCRRGVTLSETLIVAVGLGLVLTVMALGVATVRVELETRQAWALLTTLDEALSAYHASTGGWPSGVEVTGDGAGGRVGVGDGSESAGWVIRALDSVAASRAVLARIGPALRVSRPGRVGWTMRDAWGRDLRCLTRASPSLADRQAVAANAGKPIFISAGVDRTFGTQEVAGGGDDLILHPSPER